MKIFMIWGQRKCRYEGEYGPELLEAVDEYTDEDNPDIINDAWGKYDLSKDFDAVQLIEAEIDDKKLISILERKKVELKNIEVV